MKYAFVTISIIAVWVATVMVVCFLDYQGVFLPIVALVMTVALFIMGFASKK
ncbi:MAG: hypothetical protein LBQ02_04550 [Candidatus Nomurabacteria bacterium]|jgi:hypothetical protein|nr:hypothetical protein [Candidatus Nomurabacteria bacterium]